MQKNIRIKYILVGLIRTPFRNHYNTIIFNSLEPKIIKFVHPHVNEAPNLVLIKLIKNANKFLKIEEPIYVYDNNGKYTEQILKIYGKEE